MIPDWNGTRVSWRSDIQGRELNQSKFTHNQNHVYTRKINTSVNLKSWVNIIRLSNNLMNRILTLTQHYSHAVKMYNSAVTELSNENENET